MAEVLACACAYLIIHVCICKMSTGNLAVNEAIGLKMVDAGALIPLIDLLTSQVLVCVCVCVCVAMCVYMCLCECDLYFTIAMHLLHTHV